MSILISVKSVVLEIGHRTADQAIERPRARVNLILKLAIRKRNHLIQEVVLIAAYGLKADAGARPLTERKQRIAELEQNIDQPVAL